MGTRFFDQYSILHFATGIIAYFWGLSLIVWIIIHAIFEILENTKTGMYLINNYITCWPGGKPYSDWAINSHIGDNIFSILGWLTAYYIDQIGSKFGWYSPHIILET
jgi:hypothetical protein